MKPKRGLVFIALAAIAIAGGWSARVERRPPTPCASGVCRLPLLLSVSSTNATPQPATNAPSGNPQE